MSKRGMLLLFTSGIRHHHSKSTPSCWSILQLQPKYNEPISEEVQQILSTLQNNNDFLKKDLGIIQTSASMVATNEVDDDDDDGDPATVISKLSEALILLLGSTTLAMGMGEMLLRFEIFQDWRYLWPLLGGMYIWEGLFQRQPWAVGTSQWARTTSVIAGLGLWIGGAYDMFMPVWMTGPNIITNAGIGQDSAVVLLLFSAATFYQSSGRRRKDYNYNPTRIILQMMLLAELYKLGESSIDELLSNFIAIWINLAF